MAGFFRKTHASSMKNALKTEEICRSAITALARVNLGLKQAEASRYQTPALLFWFGAAVLAFSLLPKGDWRWRLGFEGVVLAMILLSFYDSAESLKLWRGRAVKWNIAGAAWVTGIDDGESMGPLVVGPQIELQQGLRKRGWGPFSHVPASLLGSNLPFEWQQPAGVCDGRFVRNGYFSSVAGPGLRFKGTARVLADGAEIEHFVATDMSLRVLGFGEFGTVFASTPSKDEKVIVFGLPEPGKACAIPTE